MNFKSLALSCFVSLSFFASPVFGQIDTTKFPVLRVSDWRTSGDIPWSQPVVVKDEFEGDYLAVFDRNYDDNLWTGLKSGVVSNWSRKYLRIYAYQSPPCKGLFCVRPVIVRETSNVSIKAGDKVFKLEGKNGNFNLTDEVAYALKNSPPGQTRIKILFEGSGQEIINDIGSGTVEAWKTVYQDAQNTESKNKI